MSAECKRPGNPCTPALTVLKSTHTGKKISMETFFGHSGASTVLLMLIYSFITGVLSQEALAVPAGYVPGSLTSRSPPSPPVFYQACYSDPQGTDFLQLRVSTCGLAYKCHHGGVSVGAEAEALGQADVTRDGDQ